jgi:hypothetical protein
LSTTWKQKRAKIAGLSRDRKPDDPELVEARRELRAQRLAEHVDNVVAGWPPLTDAQLDRIAALLRSGSRGDAA